MRVALVHDWLTGMRGGERVLLEMCRLFPEATLFTLLHRPGSVAEQIEALEIRTSFLNRIPGVHERYRYYLPLYPLAVSRLDLRGFDLILSSSHAVAKGVQKPAGSVHVCYCHTPMRYIWDMQSDYFHYGDAWRLGRTCLRAVAPALRAWDRRTAAGVDHFIANSLHVKERIARYYGRTADVIPPPIDTSFFSLSPNGHHGSFYLVVSAAVPFKRLDLAVETFNRIGKPLVVAGSGPDLEVLKKRAASNIQFTGYVPDEDLRLLYRDCRALVVPGREDFGMASLEAQACGRPVVAFGTGGSLESVIDGRTGILFQEQTCASLEGAIRRLEATAFDPARLKENAERFSVARFQRSLMEAVERTVTASGRSLSEGVSPSFGDAAALDGLHPSLAGMGGLAKRGIDILVSSCALAILGLPLLAVALCIRLTSTGPALFFQWRLGHRGRPFRIVKFRTMIAGAEGDKKPTWALDRDPRCTRLGNFLRRLGIDELPQLWNVLKGEMSLVGPRPERPEFHRLFSERLPPFARRLEVRGGLTGLAQVRGWRGNTSVDERLRSDIEYIERWSVWKDIGILLLTPRALWRRKQHPPVSPPVLNTR